ncbi:MAG: hypothetical protein WCD43_01355 [Candidatus Acidiferrales bacterium]
MSLLAFAQGIQSCITANTGRKIWPIRFAQGLNECVAAFLADFAIIIAAPLIESDIAVV